MSKKYDKWLRNKEWLEAKYLGERSRPREIAEIVGCTCKTVHNALRYWGIHMRTMSEAWDTARTGEKHPMFGKHHSEETKKKQSEAKKGDKNHFFGKHHTEESKNKIGAANKDKIRSEETKNKMREATKKRFKKEEERQKLREARKRQKGFPTHHTKPELIFEAICKKHNLPFRYVGDSSFWIGKNPTLNPDFIHLTKKIAIEIFSYWHDPLKRHCKVRYSATLEGRKKILKKYGWKMIVFWQDDLEQEDAEKHILRVLKEEKVI